MGLVRLLFCGHKKPHSWWGSEEVGGFVLNDSCRAAGYSMDRYVC